MNGRQPLPLAAMQRWFAAAVVRDGDVAPGLVARRIEAPKDPSAVDRLGIYRFAYRERLRSVMANDYPALARFVGGESFARLVDAYAHAHPSRHPNLNRFGARFPDFLARRRAVPCGAFLVELARLELAIAKASEADERPALVEGSLARLGASQQRRLRLRLQPSVQLLAGRFAIPRWYDAWEEAANVPKAARVRSWTCIHRVGWTVRRLPLERRQFVVLRAIAAGAPLAVALRAAGDDAPVAEWFATWATQGLFVDPPATRARPSPVRKSAPVPPARGSAWRAVARVPAAPRRPGAVRCHRRTSAPACS